MLNVLMNGVTKSVTQLTLCHFSGTQDALEIYLPLSQALLEPQCDEACPPAQEQQAWKKPQRTMHRAARLLGLTLIHSTPKEMQCINEL